MVTDHIMNLEIVELMIDKNHLSKLADMEFIRQLMKVPLLDKEKEKQLAFAWKDDHDEKAFQQMVMSFTRLVVSMALRFRFYGIPLTDLIQEGTVGLLYAADRFEPSREVRFSTYAKWWIRATIQDYVLRNWSIVRTGSTTAQKQLFFNLKRIKNQLADFSTDTLSGEDKEVIAKTLHVSLTDVEEMEKRLAFQDLSLSAVMHDDTEQIWQEFIPDNRPNPEGTIEQADEILWRHHWLHVALHQLDKREQTIISARRLQDSPKTLGELGKCLKISKERVRQIETRALRKMRYALISHMNDVREIL